MFKYREVRIEREVTKLLPQLIIPCSVYVCLLVTLVVRRNTQMTFPQEDRLFSMITVTHLGKITWKGTRMEENKAVRLL